MFNFHCITEEDIIEYNLNWLEFPDHSYRILVVGVYGSGKTNALFDLINHETDIDKMYFYAKDPYEACYQLLISKRKIIEKVFKKFRSFYGILKWYGQFL